MACTPCSPLILEHMNELMHTHCDHCDAPIAWHELPADAYGVCGDCPVCAARVTRPRAADAGTA